MATAPAEAKARPMVDVFPTAGTQVASNTTTFSFRGIRKSQLGHVVVTGSRSGRHYGSLRAHPVGYGVSFIPYKRFINGEKVTVRTKRRIRGSRNGVFWVRIGKFYGSDEKGRPAPVKPPKGTLHSRPDLAPPELDVKVLKPGARSGHLFYAPKADGLTIADREGRTVWFQPTSYGGTGTSVLDFRAQRYRKQPVLAYWKGASTVIGYSQVGNFEILNRNYRRIARFTPGNGYKPDIHELVITPRNTALVLAYRGVIWDARKFGGTARQQVLDNVVQEIDIKTGLVLFEWHSLGNIGLKESMSKPPEDGSTWDYFHVNSAKVDGPDSLIISGRRTSSLYRVGRRTGQIWWALRGAGKTARSDFKMGPGTSFGYQHDAQRLPNGDISLFDNGSARNSPTINAQSSGLVLRLSGKNRKNFRATLVRRNEHSPAPIVAGSQGNAEPIGGNSMFVGWGSVSAMTEFDPTGQIVFDANFPKSKESSYRAYKGPWSGIAPGRPAIASEAGPGNGGTVWASWNGATDIASWRVVTTSGDGTYGTLATVPWNGLETEIPVTRAFRSKIAVQALDRNGKTLKTSALVEVGRQSR
ncbi:MAG: arylsulfotransferase family protein [Solirubrobacterales bacterium]|nr:arylsulfotransferase family protein [Solirubrobacterales bacterium]